MRLTGRKLLLLGISLIMSFIGALGAGVMLGTGLNWWMFAVFAAMAIFGSVWASKILKPVPDVGIIIKYNFPKDAGYYQKGKRKTTPVNDNDILYHLKMFLPFIQIGMFAFGVAFFYQDNKIEHLKRVEWLYRWSRIGKADTEEYQDFERRMLDGKKEERNGMKTKIFNMERNAPQFLYFRPVDNWTPEPPEPPKATEPEQSKPKAESKPKPLPHEQRSHLTPGEIEAIKKVRANPHIPEDAKPELPEGY